MATLEDVFRACDTRGHGYLKREELCDLCSKFGIGKTEADALFEDLDRDADGRISFKDFTKGFTDFLSLSNSVSDDVLGADEEPTGQRFRAESIDGVIEVRLQALNGERPLSRDDAKIRFPSKTINSETLEDILDEMKRLQEENKRLEENWTREKREHERHLRSLEVELDSQMQQVEIQAKKKAQEEAEEEKKSIRQQMDAEMDQMQANLMFFEKVDAMLKTNKNSQLDSKLKDVRVKLDEASQENRQLRMSLMDTQTNTALLRSEIAQLRTQYEEKCRELSSEREKCFEVLHEQDHVSRQLSILQDANKRLQDTNDTLRVALEATTSITQQARSYSSFLLQAKRGSIIGDYLKQDLDRRYRSAVDIAEEGCDQWEMGSIKSKPKSEDLDMMNYRMQRFVKDLANGQSAHHSDSGQSTMREADDLEDEDVRKAFDYCHEKDISLSGFDSASQVCQPVTVRSVSTIASNRTEDIPLDSGSEIGEDYVPYQPRVQASYEATGPPERTYKVIFIGDAAVGKSSFILRLARGSFITQISSTLGVDFQVRTLRVDNKNVALQLWDTAGQERFRSITQSYFRKADGIMLLYDCTNERSFLNVTQWVNAIEEGTSSKLPVILVANKTDLRKVALLNGDPVVLPSEGQKLAKTYKSIFIESSAKDGSNVLEAVAELVRLMSENEDQEIRNSGMLLKNDPKKSRCCGK